MSNYTTLDQKITAAADERDRWVRVKHNAEQKLKSTSLMVEYLMLKQENVRLVAVLREAHGILEDDTGDDKKQAAAAYTAIEAGLDRCPE
jgi:hypothetical protein